MRRFAAPIRYGFTLIELLVVVAIIAILIGLLVPAVQKVREAAARANCLSNLKNVALACHSYQDVVKTLPRNGSRVTHTGCCLRPNSPDPQWSWIARLLPFIEQDPLFRQAKIDTAPLIGNPAVSYVIPVLLCPSDFSSLKGLSNNRADWPPNSNVGLTNYKGVGGSLWCWGNWVVSGLGADNTNTCNGLNNNNGIFFRDDILYPMRLADIKDGTSNTLMIGEDVPEQDNWCSWPYSNNAVGTCAIPPNTGMRPPYVGAGFGPGDWQNVYSFRSRHPAGLNFAFADGTVRFVGDSIDLATYRALATPRGGETIGEIP
jgi:prepilin-type N-terminal cleavage/methylation domain-containing protein/prepilin-type processing-associated H-X9-DG protein